jgi:hypothetical protein
MPEKKVIPRAAEDKREGKSASTQAGEFVREEMHHIRQGKHGARSAKQAIAIGLSEARRAGVDLPAPKKGTTSEKTRRGAEHARQQGQEAPGRKPSAKRSRATQQALEREPNVAASHRDLSRQAHSASRNRTAAERSAAAKKAAQTKGPAERQQAARKAARTRAKAKS